MAAREKPEPTSPIIPDPNKTRMGPKEFIPPKEFARHFAMQRRIKAAHLAELVAQRWPERTLEVARQVRLRRHYP